MSLKSQIYDRVKDTIEPYFSKDSLKAKVFRGGIWLGTGAFTQQLVKFGRNLLLTRLLAPEAFGLMALAMSASTILHSMTDIGVKEAIIQHPRGSEHNYAVAAWWLAFGRSVLLYAAFFTLAPYIARFYAIPQLSPLLRIVTLSVIFEGAFSSGVYLAVKKMNFSRWAIFTHGGGILGSILTIVLSFLIRGVWALAIGVLFEAVFCCILSYIVCPYPAALIFDGKAIRELLKFSKGLFGLSFLNFIFSRVDVVVMAKLFSPTALGFYVMAVNLVQTPASFGMNMLGQTMLPTLAHVQNDDRRMNRILLQVWSFITVLGVPVLTLMFFCGRSIITLAYGKDYAVATGALIVASCVILVNLLNGQITSVFYAKGLPQLHRGCVLIMAITAMCLIYPSVKMFGIMGGQLACLVAVIAGFIYQIIRVHSLTGFRMGAYGKTLLLSAAMSLAVAVMCLASWLSPSLNRPLLKIAFGLVGCLIAYTLGAVVFLKSESEVKEPQRFPEEPLPVCNTNVE
jgi:lipopolysaccharide exporter